MMDDRYVEGCISMSHCIAAIKAMLITLLLCCWRFHTETKLFTFLCVKHFHFYFEVLSLTTLSEKNL